MSLVTPPTDREPRADQDVLPIRPSHTRSLNHVFYITVRAPQGLV